MITTAPTSHRPHATPSAVADDKINLGYVALPVDPAVVALLDTAGEHAILTHYSRTHAGGDADDNR